MLIDAEAKPGDDSIYQLWRASYLKPQCAGACGEIKAELTGRNLWENPLVATQNLKFKVISLFVGVVGGGFFCLFCLISVLPGASSAYRFVAFTNDANGSRPLEMYFTCERMHVATVRAGILEKNM